MSKPNNIELQRRVEDPEDIQLLAASGRLLAKVPASSTLSQCEETARTALGLDEEPGVYDVMICCGESIWKDLDAEHAQHACDVVTAEHERLTAVATFCLVIPCLVFEDNDVDKPFVVAIQGHAENGPSRACFET